MAGRTASWKCHLERVGTIFVYVGIVCGSENWSLRVRIGGEPWEKSQGSMWLWPPTETPDTSREQWGMQLQSLKATES